jgi:hypothetical protein
MNFRIRDPDSDDFTKYEKAYYQHLGQFRKTSNTHLWKFFGWGFFHDGSIESVQIPEDLRTVVLRLVCPNIKRRKSADDYEYVDAGFTCIFRNVTAFTMEDETPGHAWDMRRYQAIFLGAEINTSPILRNLEPEDDDSTGHYSLLTQLLEDDSIIWLELVFSQVDVAADGPAAFALREADPKFDVPTWSGDDADGN